MYIIVIMIIVSSINRNCEYTVPSVDLLVISQCVCFLTSVPSKLTGDVHDIFFVVV